MKCDWQAGKSSYFRGIAAAGARIMRNLLLIGLAGTVQAASETLLLNDGLTERVIVQQDPSLNPAAAITIELWIRPTSISGCQTLVGKGYATAYWLGICTGKIRYYTNGIGTQADGIATVPVGEWSHIAVTFDGTQRKYYLNGELDFSAAAAGTSGVNDQPLGIGGEGGSASYPNGLFPFSGRLSEVRLWNYARSEEQIRDAMYQQITSTKPGLIGVWALDGDAHDRFGQFNNVLAPGASFSTLQSPPQPHEPLRIRQTSSIVADGNCNDAGYATATVVPAWYEDADRPLSQANPQKIYLGADATYLYVCLADRKFLDDPIYSIEIDTQNDAGTQLDSNDRRFRFWPGDVGLTTSVGQATMLGSTWAGPVANPAGLFAAEDLSVEFASEFEMRIPRSIFSDPDGVFRMRVFHNFLVPGGDRTVIWPITSADKNPSTWQEMTVDLSLPPLADSLNPRLRTLTIYYDRPQVGENAGIRAEASDNIDIQLLEVLVDGVVVNSTEFDGAEDTEVSVHHVDQYTLGRHYYTARAFDHAGLESQPYFRSFQVVSNADAPRVSLLANPRVPSAGQPVTVTAVAFDPAGIRSIRIENLTGGHIPSAQFCDLPAGGPLESCVWNINPGPDLVQMRLVATASDADGDSKRSADFVMIWGMNGPDADHDGLSDHVESSLCTRADNPDTDGDGLSDGWETLGIRFADGSELPLADYGVNPCWKNLLLQLDWETGAEPPATGQTNLLNQYRDRDTTVFLEVNERPAPTAYDQSHLGAGSAVYQMDGDEYYFDPKRNWAFYYGYQRNLPGRSGAWNRFFTIDHHRGNKGYCAAGPRQGMDCRGHFDCGAGSNCQAGCDGGTNLGMACSEDTDCPKDDGSFALCSAPCVTRPEASGTACAEIGDTDYRLFHELGHSAGLGHGGILGSLAVSANGGFVTVESEWDNHNFKPHQLSAMNYYYNQGLMCMMPPPAPIPAGFTATITAEVTFMDTSLGDLNENQLWESISSPFSVNLRAQDCSFADPAAFPVFKYTCTFAGTQMEVISDGQKTWARRPKDGDWNWAVPAHAPGIDWNCNGVIDGILVEENIDSNGGSGDGFDWNPDLWILNSDLRGRGEFPVLPKPAGCHNMYAHNCTDRGESCYLWPTEYQDGIGDLASGVEAVDCRDQFLANRSSMAGCGGGSDSEFGTGVCPLASLDSPVAVAINERQSDGFDGMGVAAGPQNDIGPETIDGLTARDISGVERCDMDDNDGDGEIDEDCRDQDADGMPDIIDNCPTLGNADQADIDRDGLGDACQFPQLDNLVASWNQGLSVNLSWTDNGIPMKGVVIYRYGVAAPPPLFRGSSYPSTTDNFFTDTVNTGDTYTYLVRPLNLNGEEGEPVSIEVQVLVEDEIFEDGFEQQ